MTLERIDPYHGFRFRVEIDGLIVAGFSEVGGLNIETQIEEIREGGVNEYTHKLPKETKYPNVVLKRGLTDSDTLWQWYRNVATGKIERKTVHVILLDSLGEDTWRWSFEHSYPIKWLGSELKADSNAAMIETIELVHKGFNKY